MNRKREYNDKVTRKTVNKPTESEWKEDNGNNIKVFI